MQGEEVRLERASLRPIARTVRRIEQLKRGGQRVVFISDMYLSEEVIREILIEHGMATASDPLYVSSDLEMTKRTGELFKHVLAQERIKPSELQHCGDSMVGRLLGGAKTRHQGGAFRRVAPQPLRTGHVGRFARAALGLRADCRGYAALRG